jgi:RHS repeat-associated protein
VTSVLDFWSGNVIEKYTYDAFGQPTILSAGGTQLSTSAVGNRFMFQGREFFPELGIYDYRHRMYHPGLGRFLQTDPLGFGGGDANLLRYCSNDPVNRSDPTGLWSPPPTRLADGGGNDYYGNDPYPDNVSESNPLEGIDESTMDRVSIGGRPEPGTTLGPGDFTRNGNAPGEAARRPDGAPGGKPGGVPGGTGRGGTRSAKAPGHVPNPYLSSGPLIADVWKDFNGQGLKETAEASEMSICVNKVASDRGFLTMDCESDSGRKS